MKFSKEQTRTTLVGVTIAIALFIGSYLYLRENHCYKFDPAIATVNTPKLLKNRKARSIFQAIYFPLTWLDRRITGCRISFTY